MMEIKNIQIATIKLAKYNPRRDLQPGDPDYEKLKKSMREFDLVEPLVWNKRSGNLIGGHQRLKILIEQGAEMVDVSVVDLPDRKEKALNLALNKIRGDWDMPRLHDILEELDIGDFDIEITGFDDKEIETLMTQFHIPEEGLTPDDEIPEKVETICKTGDLWQLGDHRLLCGDATKKEDIERLMGGEKADMVFTDPPYGVNYEGGSNNPKKREKLEGDMSDVFSIFIPILPIKNNSAMYIWFAERAGKPVFNALINKNWQIRAMIIWVKINPHFGAYTAHYKQAHEAMLYCVKGTPKWNGATNETTIWEYPQSSRNDLHPTQKPIELCRRAIANSSNANFIVLDPFGGSGSTLIACEKLGRRCYMCEIDCHYNDIIIQRWQNYTGKQAVKL